MRKILCSLLIALSTFATTSAVAADLDVTALNRHIYRGKPVDDAIAVQSSLTIPLADNNLGSTSFGIWNHLPIAGDFSEIDFSLTQELGEIGSLSVVSQFYDGTLLDIDSHDIEVGLSTNFAGVGISLNRIVKSATIEGDTYVELGYGLGDYDLFVGVGDGAYAESGDFAPVNVGFTYSPKAGEDRRRGWMSRYTASFIYNPDTEKPYLVVTKSW